MPIKLLTLTLLFAFTPLTFSQTNQAPSLTTRSTLHTSAHLVVLDVVVEDKDHNPVRGLKASDFQILESNVPQHARSFEEHFPPSVGDPPANRKAVSRGRNSTPVWVVAGGA